MTYPKSCILTHDNTDGRTGYDCQDSYIPLRRRIRSLIPANRTRSGSLAIYSVSRHISFGLREYIRRYGQILSCFEFHWGSGMTMCTLHDSRLKLPFSSSLMFSYADNNILQSVSLTFLSQSQPQPAHHNGSIHVQSLHDPKLRM